MKVFGLTGGIGMGKSAAADWLRQQGVPIADTDRLAREITRPDQPAWREILDTFGRDLTGPDRELRRDALARIVFSDAAARQKLEAITHPRIRALWKTQLQDWRAAGQRRAVVVIPLLFETGAQAELDAVICVACSAATQHQRLLERGWTPEQIEQRLAAQWPIDRKMGEADYVVWNESGLDVLAAQLQRIPGL
jgi:dephospho-CoA kinase